MGNARTHTPHPAKRRISDFQKGRAGEHLVCFEFLLKGLSGMVNAFPGAEADVLVDLGIGQPIRVQVKTTLQPSWQIKKERTPFWQYSFRFGERGIARYSIIDLYALVALDEGVVLYIPSKELVARKERLQHVRFTKSVFLEKAEGSLDRFLETLQLP